MLAAIRTLAVLTLALSPYAHPAFSTDAFELADLERLVRVSSPRISPDGRRVVVAASRPNYEENRFENQLLLIDVESGEARALTHERHGVRAARWSPSGDHLAFLDVDGEGDGATSQVFLLPIAGGEAKVVTAAAEGVATYEWHSDGERLIYLTARPEPDGPEGPERHNRSFVAGHHDYLATAPPSPLELWIAPIDGTEAERIELEDAAVTTGLLAFLTVAPDGSAVALTTHPADRPGDHHAIRLYVHDLASGERRHFEDDLARVSAGRFSPDGSRLAFSLAESGRPYYSAHNIFVAPAAGGAGRKATAAIDRTFYGALWLPEGDALLLGGSDGTRTSLWIQPLAGPPQRLDLGDLNPAGGYAGPDLDIGPNGELAFVASQAHRPSELYYVRRAGSSPTAYGEPRRLTDLNAAIADLDLGAVEAIAWETHDGFRADGVLIYPPDYDADESYPLVLRIHGGPMGSSNFSFDSLAQLHAARGWIVFEPNYRGSDNLGDAYQSAVIGDAGVGPGKDVMAGIEAVKATRKIDSDRIAVSGWSYGGYMTSWLIGNYPDAWAAAVAGAPVTDYVDQYSLSDVNTGFSWGFPELPWTEPGQELWRDQSPIAHLHRAKTPTLILCDTGDRRVPITESYKLYHALDDHDVPVEFVAYPVPGHFPRDPVHIRDVYRRWGDWIERWFAAVD